MASPAVRRGCHPRSGRAASTPTSVRTDLAPRFATSSPTCSIADLAGREREQGVARSGEIGAVTRAAYVPSDQEAPHLTRDSDGLQMLRLVDAGERLSIWSPIGGGALLNPK